MGYAWFVHTFDRMVPPEKYGKSHPEYFSMIDGKRVTTCGGRTQLCLTNEDVFRISLNSVREALRENPDARIISISQNDWEGACECENCRAIDRLEGSHSGTLLRFVNRIAETLEPEFPNVIFDTLAYQYSRKAPLITKARNNVCVRLCSIECCFSHPLEKCNNEKHGGDGRFAHDLAEWKNKSNRLYIWDYVTNFAHYPAPHPNWHVLKPNLQLMARCNVKGVFEQGCYASRGSTDFNELRSYLISKLLWNPDADIERHRREFMEFMYGAAAPFLIEYLELICEKVEREQIHIHYDDNLEAAYFDEEMLDKYDALFARALDAVKGDALRLWRVEKARLSVRWVRLKRKAMFGNEYDPQEIEDFTRDWRAFGMTRIDEWYNLETTHRALIDGHWRARVYFDHWTGEEPEII